MGNLALFVREAPFLDLPTRKICDSNRRHHEVSEISYETQSRNCDD